MANHKGTGFLLAGASLIVLMFAQGAAEDPLRPLATIFACFLLVCSVVYIAVHAVGLLMRDHELYKRGLDRTENRVE